MKPTLKLVALLVAVLSLNSCGIPMALVRTADNTVKSAGSLLNGTGGTRTVTAPPSRTITL